MTDKLTYQRQGSLWIVFLGARCHIVRGITDISEAAAQIAQDMETRRKWEQMWTPAVGRHNEIGNVDPQENRLKQR